MSLDLTTRSALLGRAGISQDCGGVKQGSDAESAQSAESADATQPQSAGIQIASASLEQAGSIEIAPLDGGMYDLEAIFMHSGTATGGHYTVFLLVRQESG